MIGMMFDVQEMTFHDGPGGRVTFFMKGCPLRCVWCHNPEGQSIAQEVMFKKNKCVHCNACDHHQYPQNCPSGALAQCGFEMSSEEVLRRVLPLKESLDMMEGGITFSGGEPLMQLDFLIECLQKLKQNGFHTAIETCGYCEPDLFRQVIDLCDYIMMDIKLMNDRDHVGMTGVSNYRILQNASILMNSGKAFCFRTPLIEGITDTSDNLNQIQEFINGAEWEKIPSNPLASVKYEQLNRFDYMKRLINHRS